ncbi:MAG: LVIVD repeat protein [Candidatus Jorgensenbacteria bacterium GW2011_GWA1_48_11]|uniref:LVIVD repeat protein n=1 Tax=Candidatus Jorgensenbacteria bacterium GW2011_GWA1_48_11 TaxID=1618660 RepID=A0A0G1UAT4_9BACT|nr:MAG: LVIVD repeat protein [Candidatus Jorgensenbacteria bacterium GW2011_GWA1_48_11]KKW12724.1 MAG: LVIVD repeat protein [Candidatus Jorgensenbacteria bacterium GW2011_GWB1_49_9]
MKATRKILENRSGQSLVDILIGLAIISLGISMATILVLGGQSVLVDRGNATEARALARAGVEGAVLYVKNNWNGVSDGNYGLGFANGIWQLANSSDTQSIFNRVINVSTTAADQKQIKSIVSWLASPTRQLSVEQDTLVTNWNVIETSGGDAGGGGLSGDWQNPRTLGTIDLGPGNSATGLDVKNKIVYLSAQASDPKKPDFYVVDATDGGNPFVASSSNTGPGLLSVDAAGDYAYAGNSDDDGQLQVIDVSNINSPVLVASYELPGVSGSGAVGNTVFYDNQKIYLGTKRATGPEFHVIDVSNPLSPIEMGSYEVGADINDIYVLDNTAYLATANDGEEVLVLDVANPASISEVGGFNAVSGEDGKSVYLVGNKLYLGRTSGSNDFVIADASVLQSIQQLSSNNLGGVSVNGIVTRDYLAFLATSDSNSEFQIWNIASSTAPALWSEFNFPQVATSIDYEDNVVYVSVRSNDALRIITSQ